MSKNPQSTKADDLLSIRPNGETKWIANTSTALADALDGKALDYMAVADEIGFYILDEGMLDGSPLNYIASLLAARPIYGPAVLTGSADAEGFDRPPEKMTASMAVVLGRAWEVCNANAVLVGQDLTVRANPDTIPPPTITGLDDDEFFEFLKDGQHRGFISGDISD